MITATCYLSVPFTPVTNEAVDNLRLLFAEFSEARVRELAPLVYAADAHFNDTLANLDGCPAIVEYLVETAQRTSEWRVTIDDEVHGEDGVYLRWRMRFAAKGLNKGRPVDSIGVSHLRLNKAGLVSNHQDYWDSRAGLFEHIPVLGALLRAAAKRIG